jgi:uncharacterized protein HemY
MVTVFRGHKSRVAGVLYGLVLAGIGIGLAVVSRLPQTSLALDVRTLLPVAVVAFLVLFGLFQVGKALFESDYRIVVNRHRGETSVRFGHRLFE